MVELLPQSVGDLSALVVGFRRNPTERWSRFLLEEAVYVHEGWEAGEEERSQDRPHQLKPIGQEPDK